MRIAIIGAGITGLYLARKLAKRNNKVIVYERQSEAGNKVCSGLFSKRILDFIPESESLIENRINYALVHFPKKTIKINFITDFLVMDHSKLDQAEYKKAKSEGVDIKFKSEINSPYFINCPNSSGDFDKVVGCEGANSFTRETLGLPKPSFRLGILGFIKKPSSENFVDVWPCKKGFIWKIPRGENIEYGIMADPRQAKSIFNNFLEKRGVKLEKTYSRIISQGLALPSEKNITLCGEAAGLTKPWTGGGVIWSLTAADLLVKSFPDFLKYKADTERFFSKRIFLGKFVERVFRFLGFYLPFLLPKNCNLESDFLIKSRKKR